MATASTTANHIGTPYDDVFRTLLNDCPRLLIGLVNEIFGTDYTTEDKVLLYNNEFFLTQSDSGQTERITDSHFQIRDSIYHLECQSNEDGSMVLRMFEYDVQIAMRHGHLTDHIYTVRFPESSVLYLRSTAHTPDHLTIRIEAPGAVSCSYRIPTIKIHSYTVDDLFEKRLYFMIPFYIFVHEKELVHCERDPSALHRLEEEFIDIRARLQALPESCISEYERQTVLIMSKKVIEHLASKQERIQKGLGDIMGGKILDYEAKDILNQGRLEGRLVGEREGRLAGEREGRLAGEREGRLAGEKSGAMKTILSLVQDGLLAVGDAAQRLGISVLELENMLEQKQQ